MLLEVKIENFFSIGKQQTFSMIANNKIKNGFTLEINKKLKVLPRAVIYGANANGKTNILRSIDLFEIMLNRNSIALVPFLLDKSYISKPSVLEFLVYLQGYFFKYKISVMSMPRKINSEELYIYQDYKKEELFFSRTLQNDGSYKYNFDKDFSTNNEYKESLKKQTSAKSFFLRTFINNNDGQEKKDKLVQDFYNWIVNDEVLNQKKLYDKFINESDYKKKVMCAMKDLDLALHDIKISKKEVEIKEPRDISSIEDKHKYIAYEREYAYNFNNGDETFLPEFMVSAGTKGSFNLLLKIIYVLDNGFKIAVDELDNRLHPYICQYFVKLFSNPEINKKNAQLIFTSHNTIFLDKDLFRNDEIFFVEKNEKQMTEIYSLNDFKARKGENIEKRYLSGTYGAIPNVIDMENLYTDEDC